MSTDVTSGAQIPLKKRTKSRNGCLRCKDKRRKCDETRPQCSECVRRNLPCPGYKKEIKWSLRHEKLLNRDKVKPFNRQGKSPENALFETAVDAIKQHSAAETASSSQTHGEAQDSNVPLRNSGAASNGISEESLREFVLQSDQAYKDTTPWVQSDPLAAFGSTVLSLPNEESAYVDANDQRLVDLDGLDVSVTHPQFPAWQATEVENDVDEIPDDERAIVKSSLSRWRRHVAEKPTSLVDVTTLLIDHWFREVCPMWSAFDSNLNPNRLHMSQKWTSSKALLNSMKTMAATCLMSTIPHLKSEAMSSARLSVTAIGEDLGSFQLTRTQAKLKVPLELCLALLCVGTTMCWLDTNLLGLAYWKEARRMRDFFNENYWLLDEEEQQKLAFFENSCVYWDMLCSVVSNESLEVPESEEVIIGCTPPSSLVRPHPWTGVAYKQQRLLSRTIALCRKHRLRVRRARAEDRQIFDGQPAAEDLMDAYLLSNEIEHTDVPSPQNVLDMGDHLSSPFHFSQLAAAFRLAAALQLNQTFQLDADAYESSLQERAQAQKRLVLRLAFELCSLLEDIPVASNTRCTMPILYITAATGLRFETPPSKDDPFSLTPEVLEVHRARSFILDRFASLQRSLPPKPIIVATKLVQACWRAYEKDNGIRLNVHWIDVMIDQGLSTLFG